MARRRMLILPGNAAPAGKYPDEQGNNIPWPDGALHRTAAKEYAARRGYEGVVIDVSGKPQGQKSPQAEEAVDVFLHDKRACAFYGFSGGGYNLWHILTRLASENPDDLRRLDKELIVVLGAPDWPQVNYEPLPFNMSARKTVRPAKWVDIKWELVYGENPPANWPLPKGVPAGTGKHMFGPEWLLAGMPK